MITIFHNMFYYCIEGSVDDIIVKSKEGTQHIDDMRRVFLKYRYYNLRMNPLNYAFGVSLEKLMIHSSL